MTSGSESGTANGMQVFETVQACRICSNSNLVSVLDLGQQALTGVFPRTKEASPPLCPVELVKCVAPQQTSNSSLADFCGLVQLRHNYQLDLMYGENYGYRSGLNASMVRHLQATTQQLLKLVPLQAGDWVLDIGANDGTLLSSYPRDDLRLLGVDPSAEKFRKYYPPHIDLICDFFPSPAVQEFSKGQKAKVITSLSMFYDLPDPLAFVQSIATHLHPEGVWHFEQSYLPFMLQENSYDTICHEHLEYYSLGPILYVLRKSGLKVIDLKFNQINGGSFAITAAHQSSHLPEAKSLLEECLRQEARIGIDELSTFVAFSERLKVHREDISSFFADAKRKNWKVFGYGASTKGNVLLQYCGITSDDLECIAEVNEDKFGKFTPGTLIPIVSEQEAKSRKPDVFFVLPWHFREFILAKEAQYLKSGGRFFFPLPKGEVVP